jgi:hypothetical protein
MSDEPFWAERCNPTEAGSRLDGAGKRSTSRLLAIQRDDRQLRTSTQMAFWLAPGEKSQGRPALNTRVLSDYVLHKRILLGAYDDPHVIQIDNTFELDLKERNRYAQFEVLTGYMPKEFSDFRRVSKTSKELQRLDDGPGEQPDPVILSTRDGQFAMGAISAGHPDWIEPSAGYGRFRFPTEKVVKWNVVYRHREVPAISIKSKSQPLTPLQILTMDDDEPRPADAALFFRQHTTGQGPSPCARKGKRVRAGGTAGEKMSLGPRHCVRAPIRRRAGLASTPPHDSTAGVRRRICN